jgi:hypothetical protein
MFVWLTSRPRKQARRERMRMERETGDVEEDEGRIVLGEADDADVTITEEPAPVVQKTVYDLMDDLLEADVLKLYRQVLAKEEALVKAGGQTQFGYLPRMALANIGAMNAESFCEKTLSCASLIVTDLHTNLSREEVRMLTMLRMNVCLMEYMRGEYDNLRSKIQASETRITKELRDKAEKQARETSTMDAWMRPRTLMECNVVLEHTTLHFPRH